MRINSAIYGRCCTSSPRLIASLHRFRASLIYRLMAAPGRPSFRIDGTNITYQSLDNVDETAYNALLYLYTRAAFIAVVQDRLDRVASGG
jgi:hypothetical protein